MVGDTRVSQALSRVQIIRNLVSIRPVKLRISHLHNIQLITKYLYNNTAQTLLHGLVMGRVDYCNSLLFGLPAVRLGKLQRVQNSAAGIICNISRYDHITSVLRSLHWLPIECRISFKVLIITFKAIYGAA